MAKNTDKGSLRDRIEVLHNDVKSRLKAHEQLGPVDADSPYVTQVLEDLAKLTKITGELQAEMRNLVRNLAELEEMKLQVAQLTRIVSDL
jgi:hypothetical protein